jgi:hypothetical protein
MKKLLMTAAALLALATPALASNTIPADFHGEWCSLNDTYYVQRSVVDLYRKQEISEKCSKDSDGWIKITANRYDGHEQWCKPVNVSKLPPPQSSAIKLKLSCLGEETIRGLASPSSFPERLAVAVAAGSSGSTSKRRHDEIRPGPQIPIDDKNLADEEVLAIVWRMLKAAT